MTMLRRLLAEFDQEMNTTRRLLAVVPGADAAWRPHPRSTSLGDLATHIVSLPLWGRLVVQQPELDLGLPANAAIVQQPFTTVAELLERFDRHVVEARAALGPARLHSEPHDSSPRPALGVSAAPGCAASVDLRTHCRYAVMSRRADLQLLRKGWCGSNALRPSARGRC